MPCPICEKRRAERYCPAKGEKICAVCCGTDREVRIDCPGECAHLVAAHRYENEHKRLIPPDAPFLEEKIPQEIVFAQQQLATAVAFAVAKFCTTEKETVDREVLASLEALAQTYKTLDSGIVYEKPPEAPLPRQLYGAMMALLEEVKKRTAEQAQGKAVKSGEIFYVLVFLYRMGLLRTNGRPRSRRFIEFLRAQFPNTAELGREESRIIVP